MKAMSQKALDKLRAQTTRVLGDVLPKKIDHSCISSPIQDEIADRIVANAKIVGSGRPLRDQVLIVLADYRTHSWVENALEGEGTRIRLADQIVGAR